MRVFLSEHITEVLVTLATGHRCGSGENSKSHTLPARASSIPRKTHYKVSS